MSVTEKLLRVYRVDRQLAGLKGRLTGAQRFLEGQLGQLASLEEKHTESHQRLLKLKAESGEHESEISALDERIATLRERMNSANTNKEYKALLTEVNTHKAERGHLEETTIELMTRIEELEAEVASLVEQRTERDKMRQVAEHERDEHKLSVQDRVNELERERAEVAKDVPAAALSIYEHLLAERDEEAMGPVEIVDRKRHEYNCGSCMIALPIESVSALLSHGGLTVCVSCGCILYLEEATAEALHPASKR
jgi:uncharacterized protein